MNDKSSSPKVGLNARPRLGDMRRLGPAGGATESAGPVVEARARPRSHTTPAEALAGRTGYDTDFLGDFKVPLPKAGGARARDVLPVPGQTEGRLDYHHFTVVMSASRRMAMFTAVNIEGARSVSIEREDDKWFLDGRIPTDAQWGEDLYAGNRLDRGHLVRREDPNWGREAEAANADTFHFTNCSPQMDVVNQRTWLGLENYILQNARAWKERCSVFTGPVFAAGDLDYRGALIPAAYWKVVAFLSDEGKPSATAYVVQQDKELGRLEAAFGAYKTYQRSVASIAALTGLSFGTLPGFDGFSNEEEAQGVAITAEVNALSDIRV